MVVQANGEDLTPQIICRAFGKTIQSHPRLKQSKDKADMAMKNTLNTQQTTKNSKTTFPACENKLKTIKTNKTRELDQPFLIYIYIYTVYKPSTTRVLSPLSFPNAVGARRGVVHGRGRGRPLCEAWGRQEAMGGPVGFWVCKCDLCFTRINNYKNDYRFSLGMCFFWLVVFFIFLWLLPLNELASNWGLLV